jgi:outer membrane immunogenic protein
MDGPAPGGTNVLFNDSFRHAPTGWIFGGQIGYNYQVSSWVFGVEADWQWSGQKDTVNTGCSSPGTPAHFAIGGSGFGQCLTDEQKLTNFGTARARGGFVVNDSLWYVTGGAAWATVKDNYTFNGSCNPLIFPGFCGAPTNLGPFLGGAAGFSHTKTGWTIGGGVEQRLWGSNWSAKLEYLYVDLGSVTDTFGVALNPLYFGVALAAASAMSVTSSYRVTDHIVRVGLNYKIY